MTLNDFLKRVKDCQKDKMMILVDEDGGWTNTNVEINEKYIKVGLLKNSSEEIIVNLKEVNRLIDKVTLDVDIEVGNNWYEAK